MLLMGVFLHHSPACLSQQGPLLNPGLANSSYSNKPACPGDPQSSASQVLGLQTATIPAWLL